uniref:RRM domain-containing protein n=1 Tax=Steinernema glaseri TaxID=37863 RepID=A0A1I7ZPE1_9BILA
MAEDSEYPIIRPSSVVSRPEHGYRHPKEQKQLPESQTPRHERKIFLGGLTASTNEDDLLRHFARYGEIQKATVVRDFYGVSRCFGYVLFTDKDCMKSVLNPHFVHIINGRELDVQPARAHQSQNRKQTPQNQDSPNVTGIKYNQWRLQQIELGLVDESQSEKREKSPDLLQFDDPLIDL